MSLGVSFYLNREGKIRKTVVNCFKIKGFVDGSSKRIQECGGAVVVEERISLDVWEVDGWFRDLT